VKYMLMFTSNRDDRAETPPEEVKAMYERIGQWWGEHASAGRILGGEELQGADTAATVHNAGGDQAVVTDGPFIEAKETIGGYAIVDVASRDEALAMARTWPAGGSVEVRPVVQAH